MHRQSIYNVKTFNCKDRFKYIVEALALVLKRESSHDRHRGTFQHRRLLAMTHSSCAYHCSKRQKYTAYQGHGWDEPSAGLGGRPRLKQLLPDLGQQSCILV